MGNSSSKQVPPPLLERAMQGDLEGIEMLVEKCKTDEGRTAVINQQDTAGNAAIHGATFGGFLGIVEYLHKQGGNLEVPNQLGCTPLWLAAGYGHKEVFAYLLKHVPSTVFGVNSTGDSALLAAVSKGHEDIVTMFHESLSSEDFTKLRSMSNQNQDTALSVALGSVKPFQMSTLKLLADQSIVNQCNKKGVTPLLIACERDHVDAVQYLMEEANADSTVTDAQRQDCILAVAAFCGSSKVLAFLLTKTPDLINQPSPQTGCTPLWLAVVAGHIDCAKLLLNANADASLANNNKKGDSLTPLQVAEKYKRADMVALLTTTKAATTTNDDDAKE